MSSRKPPAARKVIYCKSLRGLRTTATPDATRETAAAGASSPTSTTAGSPSGLQLVDKSTFGRVFAGSKARAARGATKLTTFRRWSSDENPRRRRSDFEFSGAWDDAWTTTPGLGSATANTCTETSIDTPSLTSWSAIPDEAWSPRPGVVKKLRKGKRNNDNLGPEPNEASSSIEIMESNHGASPPSSRSPSSSSEGDDSDGRNSSEDSEDDSDGGDSSEEGTGSSQQGSTLRSDGRVIVGSGNSRSRSRSSSSEGGTNASLDSPSLTSWSSLPSLSGRHDGDHHTQQSSTGRKIMGLTIAIKKWAHKTKRRGKRCCSGDERAAAAAAAAAVLDDKSSIDSPVSQLSQSSDDISAPRMISVRARTAHRLPPRRSRFAPRKGHFASEVQSLRRELDGILLDACRKTESVMKTHQKCLSLEHPDGSLSFEDALLEIERHFLSKEIERLQLLVTNRSLAKQVRQLEREQQRLQIYQKQMQTLVCPSVDERIAMARLLRFRASCNNKQPRSNPIATVATPKTPHSR